MGSASLHGGQSASGIAQNSVKKPAWLTDLSLGVKEAYDDNVYLSGVDANHLPTYAVPEGSVAALKNQSSWVTTISPKIGFNFAPLLKRGTVEQLSLAYAPDFAIYHNEPTESYNAHRLIMAAKAKTEWMVFSLDNTFTYIDGSDKAPVYPGGLCNAYVNSTVRERRDQFQDRAKISLRFDVAHWFIRPTASLAYYDLMTEHMNVGGYQNYVDRYDVNGGVDFGYQITQQAAVTLGYRYGHQYQEVLEFSRYVSPSDYQRVLAGFEGKPLKWLKLEFQMGPDFRSYPADTPTRIIPVSNKKLTTYYGEAAAVAEITRKDLVTFKYRQFQWVSSTGKVPYFDSSYELSYRRKVTEKLQMDLGARFLSSDYNSGNLPTCKRDDVQYTFSLAVAYALNPHVSVNAGYSADLGRNAQPDVIDPQNREYNRNLFTLGTTIKF